MFKSPSVHKHFLCQAVSEPVIKSPEPSWYCKMIESVVDRVDMNILLPPRIAVGPYGITGVAGIVTSHVAFHYFPNNSSLQFDVYSCKNFDAHNVVDELTKFFRIDSFDGVICNRSAGYFWREIEIVEGAVRGQSGLSLDKRVVFLQQPAAV